MVRERIAEKVKPETGAGVTASSSFEMGKEKKMDIHAMACTWDGRR